MKKRKMVGDFSSQAKISKFFSKSAESISLEQLPNVGKNISDDHESRVNCVKCVDSKFTEVNVSQDSDLKGATEGNSTKVLAEENMGSTGGSKMETRLKAGTIVTDVHLSVVSEVHGSFLGEDVLDMSLEEWDLSVCDQPVDDNVYDLNLSAVERCRVACINTGPVEHTKILVVTSTRSKNMAKVLVQGVWASACRVSVGDVISIQCSSRDEKRGWWVLGDSSIQTSLPADVSGISKLDFMIEDPDVLVSGTSVVGSLFCARKSVLSDRFRGFEMAAIPSPLVGSQDTVNPGSNPDKPEQRSSARIMLIGSLVHEVLQKCLSEGLRKSFDVGQACHEVLRGRKAAWDMYAAGVDTSDVRREVMEFVPRVARFMERYVVDGSGGGEGGRGGLGTWGRGGENVEGEGGQREGEWGGSVGEVRDIEENLWVPSLGLKGKVDVTVGVRPRRRTKAKQHSQDDKEPLKEMPLEVKTGRASYSPEHQGQVLLYCAMMSAIGTEAGSPLRKPVGSGLLLYLREESMREIFASRHALRDLILLRNDLVHYLKKGPGVVGGGGAYEPVPSGRCDPNTSLTLPPLPEPIRHRRACSNCPYLTICAAHLKCDTGLEALPMDHPMNLLVPPALKHLSPAHLNYFVRWSCLVGLEHEDCAEDRGEPLLWTVEPRERERVGKCISDLHIKYVRRALDEPQGPCREDGQGGLEDSLLTSDGFVHCFARAKETIEMVGGRSECCNDHHLPSSTFTSGERVLISCGERIAVSSGTVVSLGGDMLCICVDRDLTKRFGSSGFHVDKYEYASSSASSFSLTPLALLLSDTWSADRLRQLIIDRKAASFQRKLSGEVISKCSSILKGLNKSQVRAVLSALAAQDFLLVRGLPGTGKSTTIVAMVQAFVSMGHSVLVTGHTHSSVDNVLCPLVEDCGLGGSVLRLGSPQMLDVRLRPYCETTLVSGCQTPKDIEKVFLSKSVVGATCMGCGTHPLISSRAFDVCILDEAGQVLLPISLRPILSSRVFVLVGDPEQLPPVIRSHRARSLGFEQTLFNALDSPEACVTLDLQYRMNRAITRLANDLSYGSRLICANEDVANSVLHCPNQTDLAAAYEGDVWLLDVLSSEMEKSVVMVDTGETLHLSKEDYYPKEHCSSSGGGALHRYSNICEASLTLYMVRALLTAGVKAKDIGVIAPYADQVSLLKRLLVVVGGVDVSTVDQFQGRDKEVIFYSFTRSGAVSAVDASKTKDLQLLSNKHRLTVAITRAKRKLICVGHVDMLRTYAVLQDFLSLVPRENVVPVRSGECGFSWASIFRSLPTYPPDSLAMEASETAY